jgi:NodT family efflux transporter outer membrane factor (OMF) lipoprotein
MRKLSFIFLFLFGCMVGPNYQQPKLSMPQQFKEKGNKNVSISSLRNWWLIFNDKNLNQIVQKSIENNFDLKIALEKIEQTRAYYRLKRANLFPEIDLTASAIRYKVSQNTETTFFIPQKEFNIFQIGFDAIWEIDLFGRLRREKQAAFYDFQSYIENMRNVYITIISDAARYYIDICALQNIISLLSKKIEYQKCILSLIDNKKISGLDSKINVNDELVKLKQEEENLIFYSTILKQTTYKLLVLLGEQPEKDFNISEYKTIPDAQNKIKINLPSELLRNRPDIRVAEKQLARATAKVGAAIADYFPSFSLVSDPIFQTSKINNLFTNGSFTWSLGSMMKWPIITFGRIKANVDQKKSEERQALLTYEQTVLKALEDVESSFVAYFNEADKLKKIQIEVQAISENTRLSNDKYSKGIINYIDYLAQQMFLIDKKVKEKESQRTLCHDLIALYKALGGGEWEKDNH